MKKLTLLFAMLITMVSSAWADGAISEPGDIVNGHIYTFKTARNAITWNGSGTNCVGASLDATNPNHQFVVFYCGNHNSNHFYLYNVGARKFLSQSGTNATLVDTPDTYWTIKKVSDNIMIDSQNGTHFNFGGSGQITIDSWSTADEGNIFTITEIGEASADLIAAAQSVVAPQVSTTDDIHYYKIKNQRSGNYATWTGDNSQLAQVSEASSPESYWYFDENNRLHNAATENLYAGTSSFTPEGAPTYIKFIPNNMMYLAVSLTENLSDDCWDDQGSHAKIGTWNPTSATDCEGTAWRFEPVQYTPPTAEVTLKLTDVANNYFEVTLPGNPGVAPSLNGCVGYQLSDETWNEDQTILTASISFPFQTSNPAPDGIKNKTSIQSSLGESKWYANANGEVKANNRANTNPTYSTQDNWNWYIYPSLDENGTFSFQIYNVGAQKFIPAAVSTGLDTATTLSDEAGTFQIAEVRTGQTGFYQVSSNKFLTINSSGVEMNIWLWTAGGAHMGSTMSFPEAVVITLEGLQAQLATLANTAKFKLVEGATIISPSEYAAPAEINAAIDAAKAVDNTDAVAIEAFLSSSDAAKIKTFNSASTSYGAPLVVNYVAKAGYNTIILPINWNIPSNWTVYSCSEVAGNVLTLVPNATATKNRPYIIKTDADETFQFIGYSNEADLENVCNHGVLYGANIAATAPANAYVFNGTDRFEKIYEETEVAANQCWVEFESNAAALFFEAQPTPEVQTANMKITAAQWGTFWAPFAVEIPAGVKAYTGEMKGDWIKMTEVEGVIPANTGVVVTSENVVNVDLQAVESDAEALQTCYTGNEYSYNITVEQGAYLLQKNFVEEKGEEVVGWYKVDGKGFTLAPNRCYLAKGTVTETVAESRTFIGFEPVDGDATGISTIASQAATKADGKYMVKGQIVVVKSGKAYNVNGTQIK